MRKVGKTTFGILLDKSSVRLIGFNLFERCDINEFIFFIKITEIYIIIFFGAISLSVYLRKECPAMRIK